MTVEVAAMTRPATAVVTEALAGRRLVRSSAEQPGQKLQEAQVTLKMREIFQKVP